MKDGLWSLESSESRAALAEFYRQTLLDEIVPFWLRHGLDHEYGGWLTALDRDGTVIDTDKSIWFQGRAAWMFATLYNTIERRPEWLAAAETGISFLRQYGRDDDGKLYFTVTRDGRPLRMRRYVYSETFASMSHAAYSTAAADSNAANEAIGYFSTYLNHSFQPGRMPEKMFSKTRPTRSIGPLVIGIGMAQELRSHVGDVTVDGRTCTAWIDTFLEQIETYFLKPDLEAVMQTVGPNGELLDHFEGRQLIPGDSLEAAWFILREGYVRNDTRITSTGLQMLDWMWKRGWDEQYGGIYYYRDLRHLPSQEYSHDMKFWWVHCEATLATLAAYLLTGEPHYAAWHRKVHDWTFAHFPDAEQGEWYGYLHRDGRISVPLKGNMWKGPFHIPRMLWLCDQLLTHGPQFWNNLKSVPS